MAVAVAVAVAVSGGGAVAVAVAVAGLTKRFSITSKKISYRELISKRFII